MGTIVKYVCQDCGNTWERTEGIGMMKAVYYCDKCGDCKETEATCDYKEELGPCKCGGTYKLEPENAICPKCKSSHTKPDEDIVIMWD